MKIDGQLNRAARRFSVKAYGDGLGDTADIEQQSGTAGTGSATAGWSAVESGWPCAIKPVKETQGPRQMPEGANAPSFSYEIEGPAVKVSGATVTAITISKEMRLRVQARGAEPQRILTIVDIARVGGVILKVMATLND